MNMKSEAAPMKYSGTSKILATVRNLTNVDGWLNLFTGLGIKGRDKRVSATVNWQPLVEGDAGEMYAQDSISAKIVDLLPEEAFKKNYKILGLNETELKKLNEAVKTLMLNENLLWALKMARLYGGSGIIPISKDTKGMDEPFVMGSEVVAFRVFNRHELMAQTQTQVSDLASQDFGKVMQFQLQPHGMNAVYQLYVHRSRIGIILGTKLPNDKAALLNYWGDSVLTRLLPALQSYATAHDSAGNVLSDFRMGVFKIKGLAEALSGDGDGIVMKRLEMLNISRSVAKTIVIDSEGEDFEYRDSNLSGVDSLINKTEDRLVAESEYPHTILLGESPTGSNSTGNSTSMNWYDYVAAYQKNEIKPVLISMLQKLAAGLGIQSWSKIDVEFEQLWIMDDKEAADIRFTQAQTDKIYMESQAVDPREIAISRFGGETYSTDTTIDSSLRDQPAITPEVAVAAKPKAET